MVMKRALIYLWVGIGICCCETSCSPVVCSFLCQDVSKQIYINDKYYGSGLIRFSTPHNIKYVDIVVKADNQVILERQQYVGNCHRNELVTVEIPETYYYSNFQKIHQ